VTVATKLTPDQPRPNRPPEDPDLITIPAAARRLGRHPDTLYAWARNGQFPPAVKIGERRWLVSVPRLEAMLHGGATDERDGNGLDPGA
jgi:predicted DNA-binding transcriptional regulator AlpA